MKHLLMTTALVAFTALPATAQTDTNTQSGQATSQNQTQQMQGQNDMVVGETFQASELIGKRLYMPRDGMGNMQNQGGTETGAQPTDDQATGNQTMDSQATTGNQTETTQSDTEMANDDAAGMNRNSRDWQMVGEISDVILSADGNAEGLIIDSGGFLGINANQLRVSMQDIRFVPDGPQQGMTDQQDQNQEAGMDGEFSVVYTGDRAAFEENEAYNQETSTEAGETLGSAEWGERDMAQQQQVDYSDVTTEELIGAAVYGSQNEWVGEVGELAIGENGEIENVIVDVGGFLGIGEKPVALSMDEIDLRAYEGDELRVYVSYTEDELESMPDWESESDL